MRWYISNFGALAWRSEHHIHLLSYKPGSNPARVKGVWEKIEMLFIIDIIPTYVLFVFT
jgi:hypothetical protein